MAKVTTTQQNFSSGELSPKARGRFDLPIYLSGGQRIENFITEPIGPARYRDGFKFVQPIFNNETAVLIPFIYNDEQSYILEFGETYIRVYAEGELLKESGQSITAITQASPGVLTVTGHGYSDDDVVTVESVEGMTEINSIRTYIVDNATTNTFTLVDEAGAAVDTSAFTAYTSGGTVKKVVTMTSIFSASELFEIQVAQNADTMYVCHRNHAPRKLTRSSATAWTFATFSRTADPFGSSGNYPRAVTFFEQRAWYGGTDNDPQKLWGSKSGSFDDLTIGTGADDGLSYTIASRKVNVINWLDSNHRFLVVGANGGNRYVNGGNDLDAITPTNIAIRPLDFIGSELVSPVLQDKQIIFLQQGGKKIRGIEYTIQTDSFDPFDLTKLADHITKDGIVQLAYQTAFPDVVWAVRSDGKLIGMSADLKEGVYGWHRHTTQGTFKSAAVMPRISNIGQLWTIVERSINGSTVKYVEYLVDTPTYPEFEDYFTGEANETTDRAAFGIAMFESQKLYKHLDSNITYDGSITGTTITPAATTGDDIVFTAGSSFFLAGDVGREIWEKDGLGRAIIRTFNSGTEVECDIVSDFTSTSAIADGSWYLTTDTVTGLDHLEGEIVDVVTDGAIHPDETVSGASITLDYQASVVHVGFDYNGILQTMNLEGGGTNGPSQTKFKSVHKAGVRFFQTLGPKYGTNNYDLSQILFRNTNSFLNRPPELFSGDKEVVFSDNHERYKSVIIRQETPLPCNVQLISPYMRTSNE